MVPELEEILKKYKRSQSNNFDCFTKRAISHQMRRLAVTPTRIYWSLKNLDLNLLQSLSLDRLNGDHNFDVVTDLFNSHLSANLTKLFLLDCFDNAITFTNLPSLKSLVIDHCRTRTDLDYDLPLTLIFPDNFRQQSLIYWSLGSVTPCIHLLGQIKGLEKLVIGIKRQSSARANLDREITGFTNATTLHKNTLGLFGLKEALKFKSGWDALFIESIKLCTKLVNLTYFKLYNVCFLSVDYSLSTLIESCYLQWK